MAFKGRKGQGHQLRRPPGHPGLFARRTDGGKGEKAREKRTGLWHLGVVDDEGIAQSVLKRTPVSCQTTADGTGQMPLAEQVAWVGKKGHLWAPGVTGKAVGRGDRERQTLRF